MTVPSMWGASSSYYLYLYSVNTAGQFIELTSSDGNVYHATGQSCSDTSYWGITIYTDKTTWTVAYGPEASSWPDITVGTELTLVSGGTGSMQLKETITSDMHFWFNKSTGGFLINYSSTNPWDVAWVNGSPLYILGAGYGLDSDYNWVYSDAQALTYDEEFDVYKIAIPCTALSWNFLLSTTAGDDWDSYSTGAYSAGTTWASPLACNTWTTISSSSAGDTFGSAGNYTLLVRGDLSEMMLRADVNMPLTRSDFSDSKAHYFLTGSHMSDWRLQPEWEFEGSGNTLTIKGRFMFPGLFAIAKVDSYDEYIFQCFDLYSNPQGDISPTNLTVSNLSLQQADARAYYDYWAQAPLDKIYKKGENVNWFGYEDGNYSSVTATEDGVEATYSADHEAQLHSNGVWVGTITLTLDSEGNPSSVTFSDLASNNAAQRVFQLVGTNIWNKNYNNESSSDNIYTPNYKYYPWDGWEQSYIQYDTKGRPYYDANGHYVYQTVYTADWFEDNPSYFNVDIASKNLAFNSRSITFVKSSELDDLESDPYREYYSTSHNSKKFGDNQEVKGGDENLTTDYWNFEHLIMDENGTQGSRTSGDGWECYVIRDCWLSGPFKIWSGGGGNMISYEEGGHMNTYDSSGNLVTSGENRPRWYAVNGGTSGQEVTIASFDITNGETIDLYAVFKNNDYANFTTGYQEDASSYQEMFFNRILLWYDGSMNNAVIQFISETAGPQIQAFTIEDNEDALTYTWQLNTSTDDSSLSITGYRIERYRVTAEGEEFSGITEDVTLSTAVNVNVFGTQTFPCDDNLQAGTYLYKITVALVDSDGVVNTKSAKSNQVTIYNSDNIIYPEPLAVQLLELLPEGLTVINNSLDADSRIVTNEGEKHYLTYRTSANAPYCVFTMDADGNISAAEDVDPDVARKQVIPNPSMFLWTSMFYVRALDYTAFQETVADYRADGLIAEDTEVTLSLTIKENDASTLGIDQQLTPELFTLDGNQYYGALVERNGNLDNGTFIVDMTYKAGNITRNPSVAVNFQPVIAKPYSPSYTYQYEQPQVDLTETYGDNYLKFNVESTVDLVTGSSHGPQPIYIQASKLDPRLLDCVIKFRQPNVTEAILSHYDIHYTVSLVNNLGDVINDNVVYYDQAEHELAAPYTFTIANVHPSQSIYPIFRIVKTEYVANSDGLQADFGSSLAATYGSDITVRAINNTLKQTATIGSLYLDRWYSGHNSWNWIYCGHVEFDDPGDYVDTDNNTLLTSRFYHIELAVENDYNGYEYLVEHIAGHNSYSSTNLPQLDESGRFLNDTDPLIGTIIAQEFNSPNIPCVYITPVYIFSRTRQTGKDDENLLTNLTALSADNQSEVRARPMALPSTGTTQSGTVELTASEDYVVVKGGHAIFQGDWGTTTAIESISANELDCTQPIYNLQGMRVNADDAKSLPAGIYIQSGQKILVR
ncbi:MAG: hypothetical protein LIO91_11145 [Bacteroidales bacterium]|nr:hypothetical protein [Bacteroidales bacterium]